MSLKDIVIGFVAVLALALTVAGGKLTSDSHPLSSVTGPDSSFPCESHNGVTRCFARTPIRTATTTVCAIKSPAATSTLVSGGVRVAVASSTATIWDVARATSAFATTTAIGTAYAVVGNAQADIQASSSPAAGGATVFPPNTFLVVGVRQSITAADATGLGSNTAGACSATFDII